MLWKTGCVSIIVALGGLLTSTGAKPVAAVEPAPPAPKVSTFAPADDLARQAEQYIKRVEDAVADKDMDKIAKDSNTLVVIALALGLHDQPSKYTAQAGALMKAAQVVAAAKDLASAQKAVAAVRAAAAGTGGASIELKWEKVAALPELMKQVPNVNMNLKRYLKPEKFKSKTREIAGATAVIAAIAQGSIADTSEAKNPAQVKTWCKLMADMRDDAGALNAAAHKSDRAAADAAMKKLAQSCEDCHQVFRPGVPANQGVNGK